MREKVSERERFSIEASYYTYATGELEKAAQAYQLWQRLYPRDEAPYVNLAMIYGLLGNYEKSVEQEREGLDITDHGERAYNM